MIYLHCCTERFFGAVFAHLKSYRAEMFVHSMHLYIDIVSHSQYQYKVLVCTVFIPDISATDYDESYLEKKELPEMSSPICVKVT